MNNIATRDQIVTLTGHIHKSLAHELPAAPAIPVTGRLPTWLNRVEILSSTVAI